jgi:hypothetical protein
MLSQGDAMTGYDTNPGTDGGQLPLPIGLPAPASPTYGLRQETQDLLEYACDVSQKGILIAPDPASPYCASVQLAGPADPYHTLTYHPDCGIDPQYLIAHECGHVIRLCSASSADHRLPQIRAPTESPYVAVEWEALSRAGLPELDIRARLSELSLDIFQALISGPADIHIEDWLYQQYEGMRPWQKAAHASTAGYTARFLKAAPPIYQGLSQIRATLGYALLAEVADRIEAPELAAPLADYADLVLGRELRGVVEIIGDQGTPGDIETGCQWARLLGLGDSIRWVGEGDY